MLEYDALTCLMDLMLTEPRDQCITCHYWSFLEMSFRFQREVYKDCHYLR